MSKHLLITIVINNVLGKRHILNNDDKEAAVDKEASIQCIAFAVAKRSI